jgi:hypothetical protein
MAAEASSTKLAHFTTLGGFHGQRDSQPEDSDWLSTAPAPAPAVGLEFGVGHEFESAFVPAVGLEFGVGHEFESAFVRARARARASAQTRGVAMAL